MTFFIKEDLRRYNAENNKLGEEQQKPFITEQTSSSDNNNLWNKVIALKYFINLFLIKLKVIILIKFC